MGRKILASLALMGASICAAQAADAVTVANHQAGVAKVLERWF